MNLKSEVLKWPKHFKPIPKPLYVVRADDHCLVCKLDDDFNLLEEMSVIHWNKFVVRKWALKIAKELDL